MPRGQKSKLRAREKRRQARGETQELGGAVATAAEGKEACPLVEGQPQSVSAAGMPSTPKGPPGAPSTTNTTAATSRAHSDKGVQSQNEKSSDSSPGTGDWRKDPVKNKVILLVQFLIEKYQKKELVAKADMLKSVIKKDRNHFNEIFKRASDHMELAFGIDLKEVDPIRQRYALVNKLDFGEDDPMPKTGLLMVVLGVIFMKGNCAPEEEIWKVLHIMGVYPNKKHFIYGEPKKVITEDFVQLKYLQYQQVPNSDPPCYEFTWGPRAHTEVSKMKILEFVAKIHETTACAFPSWYEEALRDEEERAQARAAARARIAARARLRCTAMSSSFSNAK